MTRLLLPAAASAVLATALLGGAARAGSIDEAVIDYRLGYHQEAYRRLAEMAPAGDGRVLYWLGVMYHHGRGVGRDYAKARDHYLRAGLQGMTDAQNNLGLLHRDGLGSQPDLVAAYAWFHVAAENGHRWASHNKHVLRGRLDAAGIRDSLKRADRLKDRIAETETVNERLLAQRMGVLSGGAAETAGGRPSAPTADTAVRAVAPTEPATAKAPVPARPVVSREVKTVRTAAFSPPPVSPSQPESPRPERADAAAAAAGPLYRVQVGIFGSPRGVRRIHRIAGRNQLPIQDRRITIRGRQHHRIRVGTYGSLSDARAAADRMNRLFGVNSLVVQTH